MSIKLRKDLQTLQNNALHICLRYRLADRVSERVLHYEGRIQSLDQRRKLVIKANVPTKQVYSEVKNTC